MATNFTITLTEAVAKGCAVAYNGTVAQDPTADTFAGIAVTAGAIGDVIAVYNGGSEIYAIGGGTVAAAGIPVTFSTDGKIVTAVGVATGAQVIGFAQGVIAADVPCRIRLDGFVAL